MVGGGHAGCEAAAAAARLGSRTLLVTMDMGRMAAMSCNPAVGGVAKGQIVREIDALGGYMGIITDRSTIQFRMLNRSKGPAMWSPRAQCDKDRFSILWRQTIDSIPDLFVWQDAVTELIIENQGNLHKVVGIKTELGAEFRAGAVILTAGTFLSGQIHVGRNTTSGGRMGERASYGITEQLRALGFETGRMKTGTPARLDGRTIDFSKLAAQPGDENPAKFSFSEETEPVKDQLPCYIANTTDEVHNILRTGFADSPLFTGIIQGIGPRYCPSIEDKLRTFADKDSHQLFLEPEGVGTNEYYLNGFSSSLPLEVQLAALRRIEGLENVRIYRPGYAIEYDFFPPTQLRHTLETKQIDGLYFAGQINGTTGYEEADAQGLMAGINAHLKLSGMEPLVLARDQAYIGVLIDDLVTKGVDEPYRMFTSRAEYRILLRQDNADLRLTPISYKIRLISEEKFEKFEQKKSSVESLKKFLSRQSVDPREIENYLKSVNSAQIPQARKLKELLLRNEVTIAGLTGSVSALRKFVEENNFSREVLEEVEIQIKYNGYIERERFVADKLRRLEHISIPSGFDYDSLKSLTIEARQKLSRVCPETIGQASRIPGVSPADINVLLIYFGR